jgi:hypothetical protein
MTEDPFAAFKPSEPKTPIETIPVEKKKRGRQKGQKQTRKGIKAEAELPRAPVNDGVMVPIGAIAACRHLTDDEIKFTVSIAGGIAELSKSAQKHVVTALAKIFS